MTLDPRRPTALRRRDGAARQTAPRGRRAALLFFVAAVFATIAACATPRPAIIPMRMLVDATGCAPAATRLVVLLPGAYSTPEEFVSEGFVAAVRERHIAADLVMADAHLGYYGAQWVIDRLRADIVLPARARGYREIWLAGISLGGFAALGYAARHGDEIAGVMAIAPYPGTRDIQREIVAAGGLGAWSPTIAPDDHERATWHWLAHQHPRRAGAPAVFIGYGEDDRFAAGQRLMASPLAPERSITMPGGHDWPTWRAVWQRFLDGGALAVAGESLTASPASGCP